MNEHPAQKDAYITRLRLTRVRIIRSKNSGRIKHAVDPDLERNLSKPFFFLQDVKGNIAQVYFPYDDQPELVGLKKGIFLILSFEFISNTRKRTGTSCQIEIHFSKSTLQLSISRNILRFCLFFIHTFLLQCFVVFVISLLMFLL